MDLLKGMVIFVIVVDKGLMVVVVQSLGMIFLVVSQQICKLESCVQVILLYCIICWLILIEVGEVFYCSCVQMLVIVEEVEWWFGEWCDVLVGELCLVVLVGFFGMLIIQVLKLLLENYCQLCLQLFFQDECIDLVVECIDLVICVGNFVDFSLVVCYFGDWSSVFCVVLVYLC